MTLYEYNNYNYNKYKIDIVLYLYGLERMMMIIDFHSHILPDIDDGSKSIEISLKMLETCGADILVATPHFYGSRQRLNDFLIQRENVWNELVFAKEMSPGIALGAEVAYFQGISKAEGLEELCIRGTRAMMLEMPYTQWDENVIHEIKVLSERFEIILAHLERYLGCFVNTRFVGELLKFPVYVQVNAESLTKRLEKLRISRHIRTTFLLGSDMHDLTERVPNLMKGRRELTMHQLMEMDLIGTRLLNDAIIE